MIAGNGLKAGVRFLIYDSIKELLRDSDVGLEACFQASPGFDPDQSYQGKLSSGRTLLAGLAAGVVEATIAVTPSETKKWVRIRPFQRILCISRSRLSDDMSRGCSSYGVLMLVLTGRN